MKKIVFIYGMLLGSIYQGYGQKDFDKIKASAEKGDAKSQIKLAMYYEFQDNYEKMFFWEKKAATQGYAKGQFFLGNTYLEWPFEEGSEKDKKDRIQKAISLYEKAANQGYEKAIVKLGYLYEYGGAIKQNHKKAIFWYKKAAKQGSIQAQYALADLLSYCTDVKNGKEKSKYWYQKACEQNYKPACDALKDLEDF